MNHMLRYQVEQWFGGFIVGVWKLCEHYLVNIFPSGVAIAHDEEEMTMRKTSLLELDGVDVSNHFAQYTTLDILQELLLLYLENSCCQIWTISSCLT